MKECFLLISLDILPAWAIFGEQSPERVVQKIQILIGLLLSLKIYNTVHLALQDNDSR